MNSDLVSVLSTVEDPRSDKNKRYLLEDNPFAMCMCSYQWRGWVEKHSGILSRQTELVA